MLGIKRDILQERAASITQRAKYNCCKCRYCHAIVRNSRIKCTRRRELPQVVCCWIVMLCWMKDRFHNLSNLARCSGVWGMFEQIWMLNLNESLPTQEPHWCTFSAFSVLFAPGMRRDLGALWVYFRCIFSAVSVLFSGVSL